MPPHRPRTCGDHYTQGRHRTVEIAADLDHGLRAMSSRSTSVSPRPDRSGGTAGRTCGTQIHAVGSRGVPSKPCPQHRPNHRLDPAAATLPME